jgi:hypothetical protein
VEKEVNNNSKPFNDINNTMWYDISKS